MRQLANVLERALVYAGAGPLDEELIAQILAQQPAVAPAGPDAPDAPGRTGATLAQSEREQIVRALEQTHYNQSAAARQLGIDRYALRRKMQKYGIPSRPPG